VRAPVTEVCFFVAVEVFYTRHGGAPIPASTVVKTISSLASGSLVTCEEHCLLVRQC